MTFRQPAVDYQGLIRAIRQRLEELGASRTTFEALGGLPDGYISKLVGPNAPKRLGMISLGPLLSALGCRLELVEDEKQIQKIRSRLTPRDESGVRHREHDERPPA